MTYNSKLQVLEKRKRKEKKLSTFVLGTLVILCASFVLSVYTASNVHVVIGYDTSTEGDDIFNYFPIQVHADEDDDEMHPFISSILKRSRGDGWEIKPWKDTTSTTSEDTVDSDGGEQPKVRWANFTSVVSGITRPMAIHEHFDFISRSINKQHHWEDCDVLPTLWNEQKKKSTKPGGVYVEIGANIGSCLMEMLLSTDAPIVAFEPHPKNLLCIRETISRLEPELRRRVVVVPVALGDEHGSSTIYSAKNNMGNSVVGQVVKDYDAQEFDKESEHTIPVERLDSILKSDMVDTDITLMKLDAQGYECRILEGMGPGIAKSVQQVKFEYAQKWLEAQNCNDYLPRLRDFGFNIYRGSNLVTDSVKAQLSDLVAKRD